jgi:Fic family protein
MAAIHYHEGSFPPQDINWARLIPLIGPANAALARYDGMLATIPNAAVLLSPLTTQEAVLSSKIEGTQATMGEVFEFEAGFEKPSITTERKEDILEILNYRKVIRYAVERLDDLPMSLRLVKEMHAILMDGVRGHGKSPGKFRKIPNWIGSAGCSIEEAKYVPIDANKLENALGIWEKYLHDESPDRLIQLALIHSEFEALHPFLDGNGRLGRLLIPLFLLHSGVIGQPMFYLSAYLEVHRDEYYERLLAISRDGDWTGWCEFFLKAIIAQADDNLKKVQQIIDLYEEMKHYFTEKTKSQYAILALDWIFQRPIFKSADFVDNSGIPASTAKRILTVLKEPQDDILKVIEPAAGSKSATLAFTKLLNIAEDYDAF